MAKFNIDRLLEPGYPGVTVYNSMYGASQYQKIVEEYLPLIRDQITVRYEAGIRRDYPQVDDVADYVNAVGGHEGHSITINDILPRLLGGSVLLVAWAAFEQSLEAIARFIQTKERSPLALDDLRERGLCSRFEKYLLACTRQEFKFPGGLAELQQLRDVFAHYNGSIQHLSETRQRRVEAFIRGHSGIEIYDRFSLLMTSTFLALTIKHIDESLEELLLFLDKHYPYSDVDEFTKQ